MQLPKWCNTYSCNKKAERERERERARPELLAWLSCVCVRGLALTSGIRFSFGRLSGMTKSVHTCAIGEAVVLLHPPLPLVGVSIETMRERQQNDSLADGCPHHREGIHDV